MCFCTVILGITDLVCTKVLRVNLVKIGNPLRRCTKNLIADTVRCIVLQMHTGGKLFSLVSHAHEEHGKTVFRGLVHHGLELSHDSLLSFREIFFFNENRICCRNFCQGKSILVLLLFNADLGDQLSVVLAFVRTVDAGYPVITVLLRTLLICTILLGNTTLKEVAIGPLSYGSVSSAVEYDGETRYVRITDITDDGALGNDIKSAKKTEDKYLLHEGDILFARTGATVGKTCRYREKYGRAIYAGFLIRLVPNTKLIDPDYLYHFTRSDYYWDFVKSAQRVVAQPNINAQEYGDLKLLLPAMPEQKQFAAFVQQSDKSKFAALRSSNLNLWSSL